MDVASWLIGPRGDREKPAYPSRRRVRQDGHMSTPASNSHSRFIRIARWCSHHRWQTFVGWILLVAAAITLGQAVGTHKIDNFRLPGTESQEAYDVLAEHSPAQNGITDQLVYVAKRGSLRDSALRERIDRSLATVRRDKAVAAVGDLRLAQGGRIGVVDMTFAGKAEDLEADNIKRVEQAAFKARGGALQVEHGGQGA